MGYAEALSIVRIADNRIGCLAIRSYLPIIKVMRLSKFIQDHMEELLSDWESFAQTLLPAGKTLKQAALLDDAENLHAQHERRAALLAAVWRYCANHRGRPRGGRRS